MAFEYHPKTPQKTSRGSVRRWWLFLGYCVIIISGFVMLLAWRRATFPPAKMELSVREISDFDLDQYSGTVADIPAKFRRLDGQRITLTGNMWAPIGTEKGLQNFQLTFMNYTERHPPLAQNFIACSADPPVQYYDGTVRVTGTLHVRIIHSDEDDHPIKSVFSLDVDRVKPEDDRGGSTG